jgi:very-short-patch-repair endonuclease
MKIRVLLCPLLNNGKRNYFLDFYLFEHKIDLEIDGSQHKNSDKMISDKLRGEFMLSHGIKVFRIEWKNPTTEIGHKYLQEKVDELIGSIV